MTTLPASPLTTVGDLFVAEADRVAANAALNALLGQPAEAENFSVALSGSGEGPATHYGASARYSDPRWLATRDALVMAAPSFRYYARGLNRPGSATANRLTESNSPTAVESLGQFWSWAQSCADAGLTQIVVSPL